MIIHVITVVQTLMMVTFMLMLERQRSLIVHLRRIMPGLLCICMTTVVLQLWLRTVYFMETVQQMIFMKNILLLQTLMFHIVIMKQEQEILIQVLKQAM